MIRIGVVGAGRHSCREHLPALRDLAGASDGELQLVSICDLNLDAARAAAHEHGFASCSRTLGELIGVRPDAIVAVTPVSATFEVASRILAADIPVLIEKPLGRDDAEAIRLADLARNRRAMVSVNRRFDPAIARVREWLQGRTISHARATITRHARDEAGFVQDVGIHAIDTLRFLAGDLEPVSRTAIRFASGATGVIELLPSAGHWTETYDVFGPGFHAQARATMGCSAWESGKLVLEHTIPPHTPLHVRTGTYAETATFIAAVAGAGAWTAHPAEIVPGMRACFRLASMH